MCRIVLLKGHTDISFELIWIVVMVFVGMSVYSERKSMNVPKVLPVQHLVFTPILLVQNRLVKIWFPEMMV